MRVERTATSTTAASATREPISSVEPTPPLPVMKIESTMVAAEVGDRSRADHELTERRSALPRVLERGDEHTERGRGEGRGPTRIPAPISATTEGNRTRGNN